MMTDRLFCILSNFRKQRSLLKDQLGPSRSQLEKEEEVDEDIQKNKIFPNINDKSLGATQPSSG